MSGIDQNMDRLAEAGKYRKIFETTRLVWNRLKNDAQENGLWSGSLTVLREELGITQVNMSKVMAIIELAGATKISQGNRFNETVILLGQEPTIQHVTSGVATTKRGRIKNASLSIDTINTRIDEVEKTMANLNSFIMQTTATLNVVLDRLSQVTIMLASDGDDYEED